MIRLYLLAAALLGCLGAITGLVMAYQSALYAAFARGRDAGQAEILTQVQSQLNQERDAATALAVEASQKVSKLEEDRARLEQQLQVAVDAGRGSRLARQPCLDARLMRALNQIGAGAPGGGTGP